MSPPEEIRDALRRLRRRGIRRWGFQRATVAVTIVTGAGGPAVLLIRRADSWHPHGGRFVLPGGRTDRWESASGAARRQLVEEVIEPSLAGGTTVICARFADSTRAYQGYGGGLDLAELRRLEEIATGGLEPDLTLLLDLPVEVGLARKAPDDRTRFEDGFDVAFHRRVRNGFLEMAVAEPGRFVVVDATQPADAVAERIGRAVGHLDFPGGPGAGEPNDLAMRIHP